MKLSTFFGLGDAIYLRAVALHLLERKEQVEVYTPWPELFTDIPVVLNLHLSPPRDIVWLRYDLNAPAIPGLNEFKVRCLNAGIKDSVELRLDWKVKNKELVDKVLREAAGRQIFFYQPTRKVKTAAQASWAPRRDAFNSFVRAHNDYFRIKVGHPGWVQLDCEQECELDLCGKCSIHDAFDIATVADLFFGEPNHVTTLAQALDKPFTMMLPRKTSRNGQMTAEWQIVKPCGRAIYDDIEPMRMAA